MKLRKIVRKETRHELHALQKSKKRKQDMNNVEEDKVDDDDLWSNGVVNFVCRSNGGFFLMII